MPDIQTSKHRNSRSALLPVRVWIGLGSNLGDGPAQLQNALENLGRHTDVNVMRVSSMYRSQPWGVTDQPEFTNAVAELSASLGVTSLLGELKTIERDMGRKGPGRRWGPRNIDLDILLYGERVFHLPGLTVPHPRMHQRPFVLVPLFELEPELHIPGRGRVRMFLDRCGSKDVRRIRGE